jgi:ribose 5-phosphate isomerase A
MTPTDFAPLVARALALVPPGAAVGLGTGRAAAAFVEALAVAVRGGFRAVGVPTSEATADLARRLGVPLTTLDETPELDVAIDGADEVDPAGDLVKGYGGALVRERIVAAAARRFVVLVGSEKLVPVLGSRGKLPVEIVPFARGPATRRLAALGLRPELRQRDGKPVVTDNGDLILDCGVGPLADPAVLEAMLRAVPGVVGTGLFLGLNPTVLVLGPDGTVTEHPRPER